MHKTNLKWPLYLLIWIVTFGFVADQIIDLVGMSNWSIDWIEHPSTYVISFKVVQDFVMYLLVLILLRNLLELNTLTLQLVK